MNNFLFIVRCHFRHSTCVESSLYLPPEAHIFRVFYPKKRSSEVDLFEFQRPLETRFPNFQRHPLPVGRFRIGVRNCRFRENGRGAIGIDFGKENRSFTG